jgi:hypothetical protein
MTATQIGPNNPFTRDLLRTLTTTIRAQLNETEAEYAERFTAATTAFAALCPRDPTEQMLAAQIVGAQYAGLDCLARAMETDDPIKSDKLRRSFAAMNRAVASSMRLLAEHRQRPENALAPPPPAIEPIPAPRARPTEEKPPAEKSTQKPLHREHARPAPVSKDPSKMTDEELNAAIAGMRAVYEAARDDPEHPLHDEALIALADIPPPLVPVSAGSSMARSAAK